MAVKIEMLRCFAAVARSGKLSDAAQQLRRTPSAVSMMLKQLEDHLGEPLFMTDRKNRLSALGTFVLEQAERELYHFDGAVRAIESFANARHGHVRIAAVPSVASAIMPRAISRFIKDFPEVQIELRDMDSTTILHELSRGRVDIGIASAGLSSGSLYRHDLLSDPFGLVCPKHHPLADPGRVLKWSDLSPHRFIANDLARLIIVPAFQDIHAKALLSVHNITSLLAMVGADLGVTILPKMTVKMAESRELAFIPLPKSSAGIVPDRQIHMLRAADSPTSPAAREFENQILETVAELQSQAAPK